MEGMKCSDSHAKYNRFHIPYTLPFGGADISASNVSAYISIITGRITGLLLIFFHK